MREGTVGRGLMAGMLLGLMLSGCVSAGTHEQTLAELDKTKTGFENFKKQTAGQIDALQKGLKDTVQALEDANLRVAALEQEKGRLTADLTQTRDQANALSAKLEAEQARAATLEQEKRQLLTTISQHEERLKAEEIEQADKEEEIKRLSQAQADLTKSLEVEIAKDEVEIQQIHDRLTIKMIDKLLFDSGQADLKPAGLKVLKELSNFLASVVAKEIRIEGHTDNLPITGELKDRFPTNWELSTARATNVARYLVEKGGVFAANVSAAGHADTRPVASNNTGKGRAANRRIEIVLYPKDLLAEKGKQKPPPLQAPEPQSASELITQP
ncbi:MAG TPA: OmpA family protein [Nitrospiraceae bacterium]